ncbi:MAG TPA: MFS transporter [Pseudonocardiaceae bacterium]|nr:MFS transporter [Pseudonocardiaceae bacterium]
MNVRVVVWIAGLNLAQLPIAMRPLLITLLAEQRTGNFAMAGIAAGITAAGMAVSAPWWSRALGRFGDTRVLVVSGTLFVAAQVALVCTPGVVALLVMSALAGLCTPPVAASMRAQLPTLLPRHELTRGYGVNAIGQEAVYIGGPLWVAGWMGLAGPSAALLASALCGAVATAASLAIFHPRSARSGAVGTYRGLMVPAAITLGGTYLAYWICMGAMWVLLPAFATHLVQSGTTGVLVAIWSAGSLIGGVLVATMRVRMSLSARYLTLLAMLTGTSVFLLLPNTIWTMALAVGIFGLPLAPWLAAADELVVVSVGQRRSAEMYGWLTTLGQVGGAIGSAVAGPIGQRWHGGVAFVIVSVALGIGLAFASGRRRTLRTSRSARHDEREPAATRRSECHRGRKRSWAER